MASTIKVDTIQSTTSNVFFQNSTGTEYARFDSSGNLGIGTSSPLSTSQLTVASKSLSVTGSDGNFNVGGARTFIDFAGGVLGRVGTLDGGAASATSLAFFTAGGSSTSAERMRIDSTGRVMINTTTADARLSIHTDGTNTAVGYGLALVNDAGGGNTWTLQCGQYAVNNGKFTIYDKTNNKYPFLIDALNMYVTMPGVYALTSASAANVFVQTDGTLYRSTSSLKYKTNVQNATHGLTELLTLRPVTYKGKTDGDKIFGGLIAEEVHEAGLTEFVQYAEDGTPDALAYSNMVSLCIKSIQEQQALITQLQADVAALKAK